MTAKQFEALLCPWCGKGDGPVGTPSPDGEHLTAPAGSLNVCRHCARFVCLTDAGRLRKAIDKDLDTLYARNPQSFIGLMVESMTTFLHLREMRHQNN